MSTAPVWVLTQAPLIPKGESRRSSITAGRQVVDEHGSMELDQESHDLSAWVCDGWVRTNNTEWCGSALFHVLAAWMCDGWVQ